MSRHTPLLRHLLLLMLAAGPVQAQTVLLCEMMEVPRQETCCCEEPQAAARQSQAIGEPARPPCRTMSRDESDGCCSSAMEMSYDPEAGAKLGKPPPDRSPQPPAPVFVTYELPLPPAPPAPAAVPAPQHVPLPDGSNLYQRTERLRI